MKALLAFPALLVAAPVAAQDNRVEKLIIADGVHTFLAYLADADKAALSRAMQPEGVIFIHNRMEPDKPRIDIVPVADHLVRWKNSPSPVAEYMHIETILVDGDMAQVWGPYYFTIGGKLSHCGRNSLSLVKTPALWKVANVSFSMDPPEKCDAVVAAVNDGIRRMGE